MATSSVVPEGRAAETWVDFDFFGHQISAHVAETATPPPTNQVDGDDVPVRHFGAVLPWEDWEALAARLSDASVEFLIEPRVRFEGQAGEQGTFFVLDPSGNALEFKTFFEIRSRTPTAVFLQMSTALVPRA